MNSLEITKTTIKNRLHERRSKAKYHRASRSSQNSTEIAMCSTHKVQRESHKMLVSHAAVPECFKDDNASQW